MFAIDCGKSLTNLIHGDHEKKIEEDFDKSSKFPHYAFSLKVIPMEASNYKFFTKFS